jgi:hypothetical protein
MAAASAWTSLAVGVAFLAAYVIWTPQASGDKDSSEFTAVLATLGLAHPTGCPIYTLLGHAFVRALHGLGGGWAWAANVWSAVGGAVAMGLWHAFSARLLRREGIGPWHSAAVALLPTAALGLNPVWTAETTLAEGINRSTPDSVILILPQEPSLRLLPKPTASPRSK